MLKTTLNLIYDMSVFFVSITWAIVAIAMWFLPDTSAQPWWSLAIIELLGVMGLYTVIYTFIRESRS